MSRLQKSMKALNMTKAAAGLGIIKVPSMPAEGSDENMQSAKARVRRLSLSSSKVEHLERQAQSAVRASMVSASDSRSTLQSTNQTDPEAGRAPSSETLGAESSAEPPITCKDDLKVWMAWARQEAEVERELQHPRLKVVDGAPRMRSHSARDESADESVGGATDESQIQLGKITPIPLPLNASSDEIMEVFGVGVRLYFDLMKLFIGISALGVLCMLPSYMASLQNLEHGAYASTILGFPGIFALPSLGARAFERDAFAYGAISGCDTPRCKALNTWTAALDVVYAVLVFFLVRAFRKYAVTLALIDGEVNVRVEDYTIELFGFAGLNQTEPPEVKAHVEAALVAHATAKKELFAARKQYHQEKAAAAKGGLCSSRTYHKGQAVSCFTPRNSVSIRIQRVSQPLLLLPSSMPRLVHHTSKTPQLRVLPCAPRLAVSEPQPSPRDEVEALP